MLFQRFSRNLLTWGEVVWFPTLLHAGNKTGKKERERVWANGLPLGVAQAGIQPWVIMKENTW